jgi:hypothetical protein
MVLLSLCPYLDLVMGENVREPKPRAKLPEVYPNPLTHWIPFVDG